MFRLVTLMEENLLARVINDHEDLGLADAVSSFD
jgi:hypothetical protein